MMNNCWWGTRRRIQGDWSGSKLLPIVHPVAVVRMWVGERLIPARFCLSKVLGVQLMSIWSSPFPKVPTARICSVHTTAALDTSVVGLYSASMYGLKLATLLVKGMHYKAQVGGMGQVSSPSSDNRQGFEEDTCGIVALLKDCAKQKDLHRGSKIHADIAERGLLKKNVALGNTLISMYAKCGALANAQNVFDELPVQNVVSWTVLIDGYAQHGHGETALDCFERMQRSGLSPNAVTFATVLKACGSIGALETGKEIHTRLLREGFLRNDIVVANSLVDMYAKCGALAKAHEVFDKLPVKNVVVWTSLIAGYAQHGHGEEALKCFESMQRRGFSPNAITFVCALKACGSIGACDKGQEIHNQIVREGLLEKNAVVGNALVDMYAKCGLFGKAHEVFDKLQMRNVVSWTALIAGYVQYGCGQEALNCFERMRRERLAPNIVTFVCVLKACGIVRDLDKGQEIHIKIRRNGTLRNSILAGIALVDMYAKCGMLANAQEVFDEILVKNVVLWTTLIAGYALNGYGEESLHRFEEMLREGLFPSPATYSCILNACGSEGAACKGQELHADIEREGLLEKDLVVANALVDMYAKCGLLVKAQELFDKLPVHDVVLWNALMAGHARYGKDKNALNLFNQMIGEGKVPDWVTFTIMLCTCSIGGLLDEGLSCFETMGAGFGIIPTLDHHTSMADIFGRAGDLDKAVAVINEMPFATDLTICHTGLFVLSKLDEMEKASIEEILGSHIYIHLDESRRKPKLEPR